MDREQTNEMLERCRRFGTEMEAFGQGMAVQVKVPTGWINEFNPSWNLHCEYRVKPKPIECWVTVLNGTTPSTVHATEELANNCVHPELNNGWTVHKVVIE